MKHQKYTNHDNNAKRRQWLALVSDQGLESIQFSTLKRFRKALRKKGTNLMILKDHLGAIEDAAKLLNQMAKKDKWIAMEMFDHATRNGSLEITGVRTGDPHHDEIVALVANCLYDVDLNYKSG